METKVFNLIILDASGSMNSIYEQALSGVNETIATIRMAQEEEPLVRQYITLAAFNAGTDYLNRILVNRPIAQVKNIGRDDYRLGGCTALYDAMGEMITETHQLMDSNCHVLVTIITDGMENASRKWTGREIKSLVEELRQSGWTFTYIGANQDVEKVAMEVGIVNSLSYSADYESTKEMFMKERRCRKRMYNMINADARNHCEAPVCEKLNYFDEE